MGQERMNTPIKEGMEGQERMNTPLRKEWRYGAGSEGSGNWL